MTTRTMSTSSQSPTASEAGKPPRRSRKPGTGPLAKSPATPPQPPPSTLDRDPRKLASRACLAAGANAIAVVTEYGKPFGQMDTEALVLSLSESIKAVQAGDMSGPEAMLLGQATALQAIFMNFSRRALTQEYQSHLESFFRMALKAQNQCRMTLETLATLKNPQVVFARQANINNGGQQQVNNGTMPTPAPPATRAAETATAKNELLGVSDGQWLDTGAQGQTGGANQGLDAMGEVHRPPNR